MDDILWKQYVHPQVSSERRAGEVWVSENIVVVFKFPVQNRMIGNRTACCCCGFVFFIYLFAILSVSHLHGDDSSFVFLPHQVITSHLNPTGLLLWMFNCATLKVLYDVILDTGAHTKVQSPGFDWSGSKFTFLWLINKRMPSWIWRRGIPSVFQRTCFSSQDSLRAGITLRDWQTVMWAGM